MDKRDTLTTIQKGTNNKYFGGKDLSHMEGSKCKYKVAITDNLNDRPS